MRFSQPQRFLAIILLLPMLCGGCSTLARLTGRHKPKPKAEATSAPAATVPRYVGKVALVNEDERFVLIDGDLAYDPVPGTDLAIYEGVSPVATLRAGAVRRRPFVIADILTGMPKKGDRVFQ